MKKGMILGGGALLMAAVVAVVGISATAAEDEYAFLIRGIVLENNTSSDTVRMYATHTSAKAKSDLAGTPTDYNVSPAKFYEWVDGVKKRVTESTVIVGDEVVMRGVKKTNGKFNVTKLTINDRSFEVVGKLKEHDTDDELMTILVGTSTYKQYKYADKEVVMKYDETTEFKSLGNVINADEVPANNQQIKVKGEIVNASQWEIDNVWDNY